MQSTRNLELTSSFYKSGFRLYFPINLVFNCVYDLKKKKSHGHSLKIVGVFLLIKFLHGQLYVSVSRVTFKEGLKVTRDNEGKRCKFTGKKKLQQCSIHFDYRFITSLHCNRLYF